MTASNPETPKDEQFREALASYLRLVAAGRQGEADALLLRPRNRHCVVCGEPIEVAELCAECAKGNDPFFTSKYGRVNE